MWFYWNDCLQPGLTNQTHSNKIKSPIPLKQLHKNHHSRALVPWPCLEWLEWIWATREARWNALVLPWHWIQPRGLCLSACRGVGNVGPLSGGENARLMSVSRWLMLGPSGSAALSLSNPGALASSPGACVSNTRHRTVKTDLVMERGAVWVTVIQFRRENQKSTCALTFRTNVFSQQFLLSYLHLSLFINVSYLLTIKTALSVAFSLQHSIFHSPSSCWESVS